MWYREHKLGYRTDVNPNGLILPVKVYDGEYFPEYARKVQMQDLSEYARVGPGFQKTERYIGFQDTMFNWIPEVAKTVSSVPAWNEEWITWKDDDDDDDLLLSMISGFPPPRLE
jgi:hypothetical protein